MPRKKPITLVEKEWLPYFKGYNRKHKVYVTIALEYTMAGFTGGVTPCPLCESVHWTFRSSIKTYETAQCERCKAIFEIPDYDLIHITYT